MSRRATLSALVIVALAGCQCGDETPPPDDGFDGNVVIGMGGPDATADPRDAGGTLRDGGDNPRDGGPSDPDGGDGADAGSPDAGNRCTEPSAAVLTSAEAVAQIATWDGQLVTVVGTATRTPYQCTDRPCSEQDPCCNTCVATILIGPQIVLSEDACFGATATCSGTECAQVCVPALLGVEEQFRGRLIDGNPIRLELFEVTR